MSERSHLTLIGGGTRDGAGSTEAASEGRGSPPAGCPAEEVLILAATLPDDEIAAAPGTAEELLDGWTAEAVKGHLESCPRCRRAVEEIAAFTNHVRSAGSGAPPPGFWDALADDVMAAVDAEGAGRAGPRRDSPRSSVVELRPARPADPRDAAAGEVAFAHDVPGRGWGWWIVAAAAVLTLVTGVALWERGRSGLGPDHDDGMVDGGLALGRGAPADGAAAGVLVPDEQTAARLAVELGLTLEPFDAAAAVEEHFDPLSASFDEAGMSSLKSLIASSDIEDLELAMVDAGATDELVELDAEELANLLEALES